MNVKSSITKDWHIPRPSLSGSSAASLSDSRSRGGSASSQGSSSNHSTHSASSGSMLLSAAHLARMKSRPIQEESTNYDAKAPIGPTRSIPEAVVPMPTTEETNEAENFWSGVKRGSATEDAQSIASSTHFTVVNGFTRQKQGKEPKSCCCSHSHQITVLVVTMTILFSACILAAICFVEMRMRKETGIYKYS